MADTALRPLGELIAELAGECFAWNAAHGGQVGNYGGLRVELRPELTLGDCRWLNEHLALAGADHCYLPKRPLPPGPGSAARAVW